MNGRQTQTETDRADRGKAICVQRGDIITSVMEYVTSDQLIGGTPNLNVHLSLLLTVKLGQGFSPSQLCMSKLITISKK